MTPGDRETFKRTHGYDPCFKAWGTATSMTNICIKPEEHPGPCLAQLGVEYVHVPTLWERAVDAFHAHLDVCSRCEENPFALCTTGATLLKGTAVRLDAQDQETPHGKAG